MKIYQKLALCFITVALLTAIVGYIAFNSTRSIYQVFDTISNETNPELIILKTINILSLHLKERTCHLTSMISEDMVKKGIENFYRINKELDEVIFKLQLVEEQGDSEKEYEDEMFNYLMKSKARLYDSSLALIHAKKEGVSEHTIGVLKETLDNKYNEFESFISKRIAFEEEEIEEQSEAAQKISDKIMVLMVIITSSIVIFIILLGVLISKVIYAPIKKFKHAVSKLSDGDMDNEIEIKSNCEIGFIANAFNNTLCNLKKMITSRDKMADQIATHKQIEEKLEQTHFYMKKQIKELAMGQIATLCMMEDIEHETAERKKVEKQIWQEKQNLKVIFDAAPVGMFLVDENAVIKQVNNVIAKLVDKDVSDIIGSKPGDGLDCIHCLGNSEICGNNDHCSVCAIHNIIQQVLSLNEPIHGVQAQATFAANETQDFPWLEISAEPMDIDGRKHVIVAINNITSRKRTELHIAKLNHLQTELLKHGNTTEKSKKVTDAVIKIFDADFCYIWLVRKGDLCKLGCIYSNTNQSQHVCNSNESCLFLTAGSGHETHIDEQMHKRIPLGCYKIGQIATSHERKFVTNEVSADSYFHNKEWAQELGLQSFAGYQLRPPNGETIGVLALFSKNIIMPTDNALLESLSNITAQAIQTTLIEEDLKQSKDEIEAINSHLEESIEQAIQEVVVANQVKSEFLANMSHEIRTPISSSINMLELAISDENLGKESRDYLLTAKTSMKNLLPLINDILDISKIEAEKIELEISDYQIGDLLMPIEAIMHQKAVKKGIGFDIIFKTPVPEQIKTDQIRVYQCLMNLVGNAVKFTEKGSVIVEISLERKDRKDFIRFDITDTGIGVPYEKQDKIFDKFTQADSSSTRKYGGTGLGLSITKYLAKLLGGDVTLESHPDKGSMFSLFIPSNVDVKSLTMIDTIEFKTSRNYDTNILNTYKISGNVLVAEDDIANQKGIRAILEKIGLNVDIASDGNKAVDKVINNSYDLVLMDMQMPKMNGYEATKILRKKGFTLPIIALTAHAMKNNLEKCKKAGCNAFLTKPVDLENLFEAINNYLSSSPEEISDKSNSDESQVDEVSYQVNETLSQATQNNNKYLESSDKNKVIDWMELEKRFGDDDIIKEVVESWFIDNPDRIKELKDAIESEDIKRVQTLTHTLKGSAAIIGARLLWKPVLEFNLDAKKGCLERAEMFLGHIETEFEELKHLVARDNWVEFAKQKCN